MPVAITPADLLPRRHGDLGAGPGSRGDVGKQALLTGEHDESEHEGRDEGAPHGHDHPGLGEDVHGCGGHHPEHGYGDPEGRVDP